MSHNTDSFVFNEDYGKMLIRHSELTRAKMQDTDEYKKLQYQLTVIEVEMPTKDIIKHAEILFPHVQKL